MKCNYNLTRGMGRAFHENTGLLLFLYLFLHIKRETYSINAAKGKYQEQKPTIKSFEMPPDQKGFSIISIHFRES